MAVEIQPLQESIGAEVRGWNSARPLDESDFARILRGLRRHLVLVFRGQESPAEEALISFGSRFGELAPGATIFGDPSTRPEILPVTNLRDESGDPLGTADSAALNWHHDYSYMPRVAKETFLEAIEIPNTPCPTHFCDTYAALETLPTTTTKKVRQLRAHHDIRGAVPEEDLPMMEEMVRRKQARNRRQGKTHRRIPDSVYPVVRRHPDSGREMLYVSPGMTTHILDLDRDESDALLKGLHAHQLQPEFTYTHQWQTGDLVVFDAMGVMHARDRIDPTARRYMRQMSTWAQ